MIDTTLDPATATDAATEPLPTEGAEEEVMTLHYSPTPQQPPHRAPRPVRYRRGQTVYHEGDPAMSLYRVESGLVRVAKLTPRGRVLTVRHVLPGDYFGEEALTRRSRNHQVEALTDATITSVDPGSVTAESMHVITRSLSDQLHRVMDYEYHLQTGDLRQRVARYLLQLSETPIGGRDEAGRAYVRATHELIAEGTSSTRESVSKIVTDLRLEGLIETGYRRILLARPDALREIADSVPDEDF
ncbi:MAG TPA: cyclic nucleotide-binding domain-containing protein [Deinococcales bacterium]|nr:cyclic nucleotide-binding domain-containing protein [Deinococcales bacterium]